MGHIVTHHIADLVRAPNVVVLGIEVRQLRQLDDKVVDTLGLQSIGDRLRNQNRKHDRHGICERVSELEHDDCKGDSSALGEIQ